MAIHKLQRVDKGHNSEKWSFELDSGFARLLRPDGETAATFTPDEGFDAIEIVHFAKTGHNVAINAAGEKIHFAAWPKAFKAIKAFTERSAKAADPEKIRDLRQSGLVRLIIGGVLFLGGSILSIDAFLKLSGRGNSGEAYLFYGAILFGAAFLYQSYFYYSEARRLKKNCQGEPTRLKSLRLKPSSA